MSFIGFVCCDKENGGKRYNNKIWITDEFICFKECLFFYMRVLCPCNTEHIVVLSLKMSCFSKIFKHP